MLVLWNSSCDSNPSEVKRESLKTDCTRTRQAHLHLSPCAKYDSRVFRIFMLLKIHWPLVAQPQKYPILFILSQISRAAHRLSSSYEEIMEKAGPQNFSDENPCPERLEISLAKPGVVQRKKKNKKRLREKGFSGLEPEPCNKDSPFCSHLF